MRQDWTLEQLADEWTLEEGDRKLLGNKSGATRLGFALLLKFFQIEGRIPTYAEEIPAAAVEFVADQVNVDRALFTKYAWTGRTIEYHRHQIRDKYGTHPATEDEEDQLADWLADQVCPVEVDRDELAQAVERRCRTLRVEPPSPGQIERVVTSGVRRFEEAFTTSVMTRLGPGICDRLQRRVLGTEGVLLAVKSDPGPLGLETLLTEIDKLKTVQALELPDEPFGGVSEQKAVSPVRCPFRPYLVCPHCGRPGPRHHRVLRARTGPDRVRVSGLLNGVGPGHQPVPVGEHGGLHPTRHPELGQDAGHVHLGGARRDSQLMAYERVPVPPCDQAQHLALPVGEVLCPTRRGPRRGPREPVDQPRRHTRVDHPLAARRRPHRRHVQLRFALLQ